jgi:protease II
MLVTAALNDSQVGFPEPAKRGYALLLFVTGMNSGHSGKPDRLGPDEQNARITAWLIAQSARPFLHQ